ncbi:MAG: GNAT family N-acetyltransferase [Alphaproteobacteria bacterium]|nr:GNAT family N-acetyltransferase [Alphaproteobacteria bacterium]
MLGKNTKARRPRVAIEDFLQVENLVVMVDSRPEEMELCSFWNKKIKMFPQKFCKALLDNLPGDPYISIELSPETGILNITLRDAQDNSFIDYRTISSDGKYINPGSVRVDPDYQGQGIGGQIIWNYLRMGKSAGLRGMKIGASFENGAYSWARMGFCLDPDHSMDWEAMSDRLLLRLQSLEKYLPEGVYQKARQAIILEKPEDIAALADMDFDLLKTPLFCDAMTQAGDYKSTTKIFNLQASSRGEFRKEDLLYTANHCCKKGEALTLGKALLIGQSWYGIADFNHEKQMQRIEKYVLSKKGLVNANTKKKLEPIAA